MVPANLPDPPDPADRRPGSPKSGELSAATDASRAIVRLIPKAKLSSLPLNHFASAVVTATIIDSAPSPSTVRPAIITGALPRNAVSDRPHQAEEGEHRDRLFGANSIDDDAANQQGRNGSDAVTSIQPAKLRGRESEMINEDSFQRVDAVIDVVVPPLRQTDKGENRPPV